MIWIRGKGFFRISEFQHDPILLQLFNLKRKSTGKAMYSQGIFFSIQRIFPFRKTSYKWKE